MARENFAGALSGVLVHEGLWSDHPSDPGGATMKGVTLATYRRYRPSATKEQLRNISDAELQRIYRDGYWDKVRGDELPSGVDYAVFDYAVNSGPGRAIKHLQAILGVAQDGAIGPVTMSAVLAGKPADIVNRLCDRRMSFLRNLSTWSVFGKGWSRRVEDVRAKSLTMVTARPTQPRRPIPAPTPPDTPQRSPSGLAVGIIIAIIAAALGGFFIFGR